MRGRPAQTLVLAAASAIVLAGCGGGGPSGGAPTGRLNFRVLWQQQRARAERSLPRPHQEGEGGFGAELPDAVRTARVIFESDGFRC
ncbi:MAG TPA: hypothetical protein VLF14_10030, partial [Candidatus Binatia bacterium]|nr:hypothetical protein [Candidatus Binatia bacterium]